MTDNNELRTGFIQYLDDVEAKLDSYIDSGSEHDLFVASYIHGHFSLVAAKLMRALAMPDNAELSLEQWQMQTQHMLKTSIDEAVAKQELSPEDASDVLNMVNSLYLISVGQSKK